MDFISNYRSLASLSSPAVSTLELIFKRLEFRPLRYLTVEGRLSVHVDKALLQKRQVIVVLGVL